MISSIFVLKNKIKICLNSHKLSFFSFKRNWYNSCTKKMIHDKLKWVHHSKWFMFAVYVQGFSIRCFIMNSLLFWQLSRSEVSFCNRWQRKSMPLIKMERYTVKNALKLLKFTTKMHKNEPEFYRKVIMNDEAHFHLWSYVSKQNCHIWVSENP